MPDAADGTSSVPVAVLIDADNVAADMLETVLAEAARFGRPTIRRVYGNWTGTELQGWKKLLHDHALQPVQQFAYVPGKNATDTALIIDAMDLLHGGQAEVFCLVSSDSDYTRLAMRLRESGKTVVGMGRAQTPKSLIKACDRFIALDTLSKGKQKVLAAATESAPTERG
ncbi:MAG TPA: NYN domain-containing protein, partial [Candidatus Thermoplasmatota archaeon]|nr:NYN domain-containing protein [Candidatus Thermoplasmatota archaeon]